MHIHDYIRTLASAAATLKPLVPTIKVTKKVIDLTEDVDLPTDDEGQVISRADLYAHLVIADSPVDAAIAYLDQLTPAAVAVADDSVDVQQPADDELGQLEAAGDTAAVDQTSTAGEVPQS